MTATLTLSGYRSALCYATESPPSRLLPPSRPSLASRPPKVILYDLTNRFRSCDLYTTDIPSVRYPFIKVCYVVS